MRHKFYRSVIRLSGTYTVGNLAQNALTVLLVPLYTTYLSTEDFGVLALLMLTVSLATRLIWPPLAAAMARYYYKPEYRDKQQELVFNLLVLLAVKSLVLTVIYWACAPLVSELLFPGRDLTALVQLYAVVLLLEPAQKFSLALVRYRKMALYYVLVSLASLAVSFGLIIYLMAFAGMGLYAVAYGRICSLSLTVLFCLPVLIRHSKPRLNPSVLAEPLAFGYPLLVTGYSNLALQSGDRYVLKALGSLSTVGVYSFGYKISSLMLVLLVQPLANALRPLFAEKESDPNEQRSLIRNCATYYYVVAAGLALAMSVFAREVVMLFGRQSEYWNSWVIVPIIAFSYLQHGLGNFVGWGLTMANKAFHISGCLLFTAMLNIALNFALIPLWGLLGAAFATLIAYLVWNALKMYFSAKFYDLHFDLRRLVHVTVVGVALYAVALVFGMGPNVYVSVSVKVLAVLAFAPALLVSGFFTKAERQVLRNIRRRLRSEGPVATLQELLGRDKTLAEAAPVGETADEAVEALADET